jgi:hypothetical protein
VPVRTNENGTPTLGTLALGGCRSRPDRCTDRRRESPSHDDAAEIAAWGWEVRPYLVAVLAVSVFASVASAALVDARYLVAPGLGVGPVKLGMKMAEVEATLGAPAKVDRDARTVWYTWRDAPQGALRSLVVETVDDLVILISVAHDERYRTREGIGAGDTDGAVRDVYGRPSGVLHLPGYDMLEYRARGVSFVVDTGTAHPHLVTGVVVAAHL